MKIDAVIREVETIRDVFSPLLAESHKATVGAALKSLYEQRDTRKKLHKKAKAPPWKLVIPPSAPLMFRSTESEQLVKHKLEVDLACSLTEPGADGIPQGTHNIAVRVWSKEPTHCFRADLDAESLRDSIEAQGRRVMLKFHFDLANKDQEGPRHHLQIGGTAHGHAEHHWLPENWKLPRFMHSPVNLVLVCEFVGRTFYPSAFRDIAEDASWVHAVKEAEEAYLFPFLKALPYVTVDTKKHKASLLTSVWNA